MTHAIRRTVLMLILCLLAGPRPAWSGTLCVPGGQPHLRAALARALAGDTILVAPGIYQGPGNRDLDFGGKDLVLIGAGGAAATVIDCEGRGRGFVFRGGETPACLVRGFTVTGARALGFGADGKGAGLYCGAASPRVEACVFTGGEAVYGGGLGAEGGARPRLRGCLFLGNRARLDGGALYLRGAAPRLEDCALRRNRAGAAGDEAFLLDAAPVFTRCRRQGAADA
ncbi:MAG: hypothetical protein JW819_01265 [Candidatus Krumholzibacteriota bacterium]|nr:hypothetical protein [Candidatus Krumholzibacteriota bacterium]